MANCFYCNQNIADPKFVVKKNIYNKLGSNYGIGLLGVKKTTRYYEREFLIERCANCKAEHDKGFKAAVYVFLITIAISATITYIFARRWYVAAIVAVIAGILSMTVYFGTVNKKRLKHLGIKDEEDIKDFTPMQELLSNGWSIFKP